MAPTRASKLASSSSSTAANQSSATDEPTAGTGTRGSTGMRGVKRTNSDMQQSVLSFAPKKNLPPTPKKTPSSRAIITTTLASDQDEDDAGIEARSPMSAGMMSPPATQPSPTKKVRTDKSGLMMGGSSSASSSDLDEPEVKEVEGNQEEEALEPFVLDKNKPSVLADAWTPLVKLGKETKLMKENLELVSYPESGGSIGGGSDLEADEEIDADAADDDEDEHILTPKGKVPSYVPSAQTGTKTRRAMLSVQTELDAVRAIATKESAIASSSTASKKTNKGKKVEEKKKSKTKGKEEKNEDGHEHLDPKDKRWENVFWEAHGKMGGDEVAAIHCTPKSHTRIHHILRVFDLSPEYGPAIGVSRLQRWQRAEEWGLNPPAEIKDILLTLEGAEDATYRENVFYGTGIYATN